MPTDTPDSLRARFGMVPIPLEGGWVAEGPRTSALSQATVLLTDEPDGQSRWHRLSVDEGWQWLAGAPVDLSISTDPSVDQEVHALDADSPAALVPANTWMAARTAGSWSLISCWCAPAFTSDAFELWRG